MIDDLTHFDDPRHRVVYRRRRAGYLLTSSVLVAIMVGAVLDATGLAVYGVDSTHVDAEAGGVHLDVRYGEVTRPALATPFEIEVAKGGGFDGPVTVTVTSSYLAMWDENGLDPSPSEETATPDDTIWTFEPPDGDVLAISFDGRIEPAAQSGRSGRVAVLDERGTEIVAVEFHTRVLP